MLHSLFECGVILNGSQTNGKRKIDKNGFECGVILNGSQTLNMRYSFMTKFECGVILNGSQTRLNIQHRLV